MVTERMLVSRELTAKLATQTTMSPQGIARLVGVGILIFVLIVMASSGTYVVKPGYRGVEVTMGKVSTAFKPEGFGLKAPFITTINQISIRQQTVNAQMPPELLPAMQRPSGSVVSV